MRIGLLVVLTFVLGACSVPAADPARVAQADQAYDAIRQQDAARYRGMAMAERRTPDLESAIAQLKDHTYASRPTSVRTVGWASQSVNGIGAYRVMRLHQHAEGPVQADVVMAQSPSGEWLVDGVHVMRVTAQAVAEYEQATEAAKFSLSGKPLHQYLILIAAALSATFCLASVVVAGLRKRWGWLVLNLFGVGQITLNWTTGALAFQPIYFALLGAGFLKGVGPADPWLIMVAIPVPALLFWGLGKWRRRPSPLREATETFEG